jgi:hypothetical protein
MNPMSVLDDEDIDAEIKMTAAPLCLSNRIVLVHSLTLMENL